LGHAILPEVWYLAHYSFSEGHFIPP